MVDHENEHASDEVQAGLKTLLDPTQPMAKIWAKTNMRDPSDLSWLALPQHAADTMLTAGYVWDEFLAKHVKDLLSEALGGEQSAREITMFLAGSHDVGKATPAFEKQARGETGERRLADLASGGFEIPSTVVKSSTLRHEISGYWAMMEWLGANMRSMTKTDASRLAVVIGGHHGVFHLEEDYGETQKRTKIDYYGGSPWTEARQQLISCVSDCVDAKQALAEIDAGKVTQYLQSLLTGIVTMSDWIASDSWNFRLTSNGLVDPSLAVSRARHAWTNIDLPTSTGVSDRVLSFAEMFDLPETAKPNAMQSTVRELAVEAEEPCLMLIEAPMGSGKTEAALDAARELALKYADNGIAFALPTQATADGILPRVARWASGVIDGDAAIRLMHGRAAMNDDYMAMLTGSVFDETAGDGKNGRRDSYDGARLMVNRWFDGSKQGLLANFVVCTIDQILMAALQAKHFDLRHLGLAGKCVIVDEIHAADSYMEVYLERAVEWLASMGCPVIMLSATLPELRRAKLLMAYQYGASRRTDSGLKLLDFRPKGWPEHRLSYPLVSVASASGSKIATVSEDGDAADAEHDGSKSVSVHHLCLDGRSWIDDLKDRLADGGNAVVIRNTVNRAQESFEELLDDEWFDDCELTLIHARFLPDDRKRNENGLRRKYGREATTENSLRPSKSVVVATQVVEQSLDVDFDYMITDVCPMDLLLQRIGRLHRHERDSRPVRVSEPIVAVDGWASGDDGLPKLDPGCKAVYGESRLLRAIALTAPRSTGGTDSVLTRSGRNVTVKIPGDLPRLVQSAYDFKNIPGNADAMLSAAIKKADEKAIETDKTERKKATAFLLRPPVRSGETRREWTDLKSSNSIGKTLENDLKAAAQVRDSEGGLTVLLMREAEPGYATFLEDDLSAKYGPIPLDTDLDDDLGKIVANQTIGLPAALSNPGMVDDVIDWLEDNALIAAWQYSRWVAGEFVVLMDEEGCRNISIKHRSNTGVRQINWNLRYDQHVGLICDRKKG